MTEIKADVFRNDDARDVSMNVTNGVAGRTPGVVGVRNLVHTPRS